MYKHVLRVRAVELKLLVVLLNKQEEKGDWSFFPRSVALVPGRGVFGILILTVHNSAAAAAAEESAERIIIRERE